MAQQQQQQQAVYAYPQTGAVSQEGYSAYPVQAYAQPQAQVAYAQPQAPVAYQAYAQPQAAYGYPGQQAYYSNPDELRTIFLTGFPSDVKERELANLLRFVPGYEACQLNWKGEFAQGFALFSSGPAAQYAAQMLNDVAFDNKNKLRAEIARKNMYIKNSDPAKKARTDGGSYYPSAVPPSPAAAHQYTQVSNTRDNPPCSTLFVGNLGEKVTEAELLALFGAQPGFVTLKLLQNARSATAFVEYADLASAMTVHDAQQGAVLQSSERGGIRIQYSKNPYGKKRDHAGNPVDPSTLPPTNKVMSSADPNSTVEIAVPSPAPAETPVEETS